MKIWNIAKGTVVGGIILFILGMVLQFIPWGFAAVEAFPSKSEIGNLLSQSVKAGMFYSDEKVSAIIAVKDLDSISYTGSFIIELFTQIFAAALISLFLFITPRMKDKKRIGIIMLIGFGMAVSVYIREINWWGFTLLYAFGMVVNLLFSWFIVSYILAKLFFKTDPAKITNE